MQAEEIPVAFDCQGAQLVGIVHRPETPRRRGVVAIVAGGPQYRGGCCRQLLVMARRFAAAGVRGELAIGVERFTDDIADYLPTLTRPTQAYATLRLEY